MDSIINWSMKSLNRKIWIQLQGKELCDRSVCLNRLKQTPQIEFFRRNILRAWVSVITALLSLNVIFKSTRFPSQHISCTVLEYFNTLASHLPTLLFFPKTITLYNALRKGVIKSTMIYCTAKIALTMVVIHGSPASCNAIWNKMKLEADWLGETLTSGRHLKHLLVHMAALRYWTLFKWYNHLKLELL